jgi:hypothetical protein
VGKAKAVTATARKIAVLFYNAMRFGMNYQDPGADHYESRYRSASSSSCTAVQHSSASPFRSQRRRVFLRKAAAYFARESM